MIIKEIKVNKLKLETILNMNYMDLIKLCILN